MRLRLLLAALTCAAACSGLPTEAGGVIGLELRVPAQLSLANGQTITLAVRALDRNGDSVAADIRWRTADTTLITLDSIHGVVTGRSDTGSARVQAAFGSLHSDVLTLSLKPASTVRAVP